MTVTVKGKSGNPYPDLPVYAFTVTPADPTSGSTEPVVTYSGYNGKTDAEGKVVLTLPAGDYRFRSDYDGVQFWSDTTTPCSVLAITTAETPGCQTAEVVLPGGTGKINVTIDYEYDDLSRITSSIYTDAENTSAAATSFTYTYDAAGNVEEYVSVIAGQTVTTTYRYNEANELISATRNNVVWVYEYDGNGALLSTQPESGLASGSKKYSYNTAGYLTKVEGYTGNAWYTQAEMSYTGLGDRLSMTGSTEDGQSVSTTYALSNGTVLLANASGKVTAYLYGNGAIGEQSDAWSYALIDGVGTPRQMVDQSAKVTALASYTPWGDVLQSGGTGSFATGMMGGILDATTGLIYVGNGQYFDPETGRFLTRGNQRSEAENPYTPWKGDPTQALVSPLILLALLYTRRKNRNKFDTLLVVLVVLSAVGLSLSAYRTAYANDSVDLNKVTNSLPSTPISFTSLASSYSMEAGNILNPGSGIQAPIQSNCLQSSGGESGINEEDIRNLIDFISGYSEQYATDYSIGLHDDISVYISSRHDYQNFTALSLLVTTVVLGSVGIDPNEYFTNLARFEVRRDSLAYFHGREWGRRACTVTAWISAIKEIVGLAILANVTLPSISIAIPKLGLGEVAEIIIINVGATEIGAVGLLALVPGIAQLLYMKGNPINFEFDFSKYKLPLMGKEAEEVAKQLGYTQRVPAQKLPFDSHGEPAFYNRKTKTYITPDNTGHKAGGAWKMFKNDKRIGTYNIDLTVRIGK